MTDYGYTYSIHLSYSHRKQSKILNEFNSIVKQDDEFLRFFNLKIKSIDKNPSQLNENKVENK